MPEALPDDVTASPRQLRALRAKPNPRGLFKRPVFLTLFILLCLLVMTVAFLGSRYYRGGVPSFVWTKFSTDDAICRSELPGSTTEIDLAADPNSPCTRSGKKFVSNSLFTRISGFVGWYELNPEVLKTTRIEDILAAERERRKAETGWEVEAVSVSAKIASHDALEVRYTSGSLKAIERYICVAKGPKPRLYLIGVSGSGLNPDGETAQRVLGSLWFEETK